MCKQFFLSTFLKFHQAVLIRDFFLVTKLYFSKKRLGSGVMIHVNHFQVALEAVPIRTK